MNIPKNQIECTKELILDEHLDTNFYSNFDINSSYQFQNHLNTFNPYNVKFILTELRTLKYSIHIDKFNSETDNLTYLAELIKNKSQLVFILSELEKAKLNIQKQNLILNEAIKIYNL